MTLAREPNHPVSQHSQEQVLPKSRRGKENLQKLSLVAPAVGPDVVNLLFLWPARLREVTFSRIFNSIHSEEYIVLEIEKSLDIHQGSLERIDIPTLPENGLPNFSSFCELHHLCIHASSLFRMSPYNAWTRLQAPRLRHLTINLDSERESASFDDFGHTESQWLKALLPMIKPVSSPQSSLSENLSTSPMRMPHQRKAYGRRNSGILPKLTKSLWWRRLSAYLSRTASRYLLMVHPGGWE